MSKVGGPSDFLFDPATGALIVTNPGGGATTNVNLAAIAGSPPSFANSLPVELSDGSNPLGVSGNPIRGRLDSWAGGTLSASIATPPVGTENGPVTRPIQRRATTILSTTNLTGGGSFTSAWFDTLITGTSFVTATVTTAGGNYAAGALKLQQTDDTGNANQVANVATSNVTNTSQTTAQVAGVIGCRYWRVTIATVSVATTSFEISATEAVANTSNIAIDGNSYGTTAPPAASYIIETPFINTGLGDAVSTGQVQTVAGANALYAIMSYLLTGTPGGTASAQQRTPSTFKTVSATASGSTALWTPAAGKKFRLMRFKVQVTSNAVLGAAAVLSIKLLDAAADTNLTHDVFVPNAAGTTMSGAFSSDWIDLGNGYLSAGANNVLNVNLSAALTGGNVRVIACGTEE